LPVHDSISKISPQNPVLLAHASGHSIFANAKAMELAGIDEKTPNPEGGEIIKDSNGKPIGIFLENAEVFFDKALEKYEASLSPDQVAAHSVKALELANRECLENGVTTFHDAGASFDTIDLYKKLYQEGKLGVRLNVMIIEPNAALRERISQYKIIGMYDHHLTVRSIKRIIDGALGSHGAWLLKPYDSLPGSTGINTEPIETMKETARIAIENGFQLCTHAIGDRGNRETLDIYEEAFKLHPDLDKKKPAVARRTCPASRSHRYTPLWKAGSNSRHAGDSLHIGRALGNQATGGRTDPTGRLCVEKTHRYRGDYFQWHGCPG
jgi:predicted amidohydrolase YtcJ